MGRPPTRPETKRVALVAFNGEAMCFVHVLFNALDMVKWSYDVKVVIEGSATQTVNEFNDPGHKFNAVYREVKEKGLINCVCRACAATMGALDGIQAQRLPFCNDMRGHPSLAAYIDNGYEVITF